MYVGGQFNIYPPLKQPTDLFMSFKIKIQNYPSDKLSD